MSIRKLSNEEAEAVRYFRDHYDYSQRELADIFGVSRATIRRELNRPTNRPTIYPAKDTGNGMIEDIVLETLEEEQAFEPYGSGYTPVQPENDFPIEEPEDALPMFQIIMLVLCLAVVVGLILAKAFDLV